MEYKVQGQQAIKPRLIIHGGAGNIQPDKFTPERYAQYREALLNIVRGPLILSLPSRAPRHDAWRPAHSRATAPR